MVQHFAVQLLVLEVCSVDGRLLKILMVDRAIGLGGFVCASFV